MAHLQSRALLGVIWRQLLCLLLDSASKFRVDLGEHIIGSVASILLGSTKVNSNVVHKVILLTLLLAQNIPKVSSLNIVIWSDLVQVVNSLLSPLLVLIWNGWHDLLVRQLAVGGWVVRVRAVVAINRHLSITLERVESVEWGVDWDLLIIDTKSVTLGIWVREQTGLKNWIGRWLNTWNKVGWCESNLLDLGVVVLNVLVQCPLSDLAERELLLWPNLGQVEDVEAELLGFLGRHNLDVDGPGWVVTLLDGLKEVLGVVVWVLRRQLAGLLIVEGLDTLVGAEVDLDVVESEGSVWLSVVPLVGVAGVAVHMAVRVWSSAIGEEDHDLMDGLLVGGQVVPEHGGILQVRLRVALLGVDEEWKLGWVAEEEDWGVVVDPVPVTFLCVELDGETAWVASGIWRSLLTTDGGKTCHGLSLLSDLVEHVDDGDIGDLKTSQLRA